MSDRAVYMKPCNSFYWSAPEEMHNPDLEVPSDNRINVHSLDSAWWIIEGEPLLEPLKGVASKLPYDIVNDSESLLREILQSITNSIQTKQWQLLILKLEKFQEWMFLKVSPNRNVLSRFATLLYLISTDVEITCAQTRTRAVIVLQQVLKKYKKQLIDVSLTLPVEPMFMAMQNLLFPFRMSPVPVAIFDNISHFVKASLYCLKFYDKDVAKFVMEEAYRWFDYLNPDRMVRFLIILVLFLPSRLKHEVALEIKKIFDSGSKIWVFDSRRVEILILALMARLSKYQKLNWDDDFPFYMNLMIRHFKLTQPEANSLKFGRLLFDENNQHALGQVRDALPTATRLFGKFVAFNISNQRIWPLLEKYLSGLDSYSHPSNFGRWSDEITTFITTAVAQIAKNASRNLDVSQPAKAFTVKVFWPGIKKLIFSKNPLIVISATTSAKNLTYLDQSNILSELVGTIAKAINVLGEPHRTISSIGVAARICRYYFEQENLPYHEPNLLQIIPYFMMGIDINDPLKSSVSLNLLMMLLMTINFVPYSGNGLEMTTSFIEELISMILERSFIFIEAISRESSPANEKGNFISKIFKTIWILLFFKIKDESLWEFAVEKVRVFLSQPLGFAASGFANYLSQAVTWGHWKNKSINLLLLPTLSSIELSIRNGEGCNSRASDESCNNLIWNLSTLLGLLKCSCDCSLPYLDEIKGIVALFSNIRQPTCVFLCGKIIKSCIRSWSEYSIIDQGVDQEIIGLAQIPRKIADINLNWFNPNKESLAAATELHSLWTRVVDGLKLKNDEEQQKTWLNFCKYVFKSHVILNGSLHPSMIIPLISYSKDDSRPIELRSLALQVVLESLQYYCSSKSTIDGRRGWVKLWCQSLQIYPKQKELPPSFQAFKCSYASRDINYVIKKLKTDQSALFPSDLLNQIVSLALGNFRSIREPAQRILGLLSANNFSFLSSLVYQNLIPTFIQGPKSESSIKGFVYSMRTMEIWKLITSSVELAEPVLSTAFEILQIPGVSNIPNLMENLDRLMLELSSNSSPASSTTCKPRIKTTIEKYIKFSYNQSFGWKSQIICLLYVSILIESCDDINILSSASSYFLTCMSSDVQEVRKLAVNRGIAAFYRYWLLSCGITRSIDIDVMNEREIREMKLKCFGDNMIDVSNIMNGVSTIITWVIQEGGAIEGAPRFRSDMAELFQIFSQCIGEDVFKIVKQSFDKCTDKSSITFQRGNSEILAGIIKGLSVIYPNSSNWQEVAATCIEECLAIGGSESGQLWSFGFHYINQSISKCKVLSNFIFRSFLRDVNNNEAVSSVLLSIKLQIITAIISCCPEEPLLESLIPPVKRLIESPYDIIRKNSAILLGHLSKFSHQIDIPESLNSLPLAKSYIFLAEYMSKHPLESNLWDIFSQLLGLLIRTHQFPDNEIQISSKRVIRVLAWSNYAMHIDLILSSILREAASNTISNGTRRLIIEFGKLFYGRNFILISGGQICEQIQPFLNDQSVEVRQETSEYLGVVFHSDLNLASKYYEQIYRQLKLSFSKIGDSANLIPRHGLILASGALILSQPYDISDWLPSLLTILTRFLNDRYPIPQSVRKVVSEFKRTHGDTWEQDREKFTEDELDAISELLVAPSYYA